MTGAARELESILVTALAPLPLYFTGAINRGSVLVFHLALAAIAAAVLKRRGFVSASRPMRIAAYGYLVFFPLDILFLSGDLIRSSSHLLFFIAVYLNVDAPWEQNHKKRLLVSFLIFIAAIATATHLSILPFVVFFAFLMFHQLIAISRQATVAQLEIPEQPLPSLKPAGFYVVVAGAIAVVMFPFLPRLGNPMVRGFTAGLETASTGLTESIDFENNRSIALEEDVVARIWMPREAVPFFTPIRLRGLVYDRNVEGKWRIAKGPMRGMIDRFGVIQVARPIGYAKTVRIQQQPQRKRRLLLPEGTYAIADIPHIMVHPGDTYSIFGSAQKPVEYRAALAREVVSAAPEIGVPQVLRYPISAEVAAFTRGVVGEERDPETVARRIEAYLSRNFQYLDDPAELGRPVPVEEFLLGERRGHCEYFAAGMVVMLTAEGIPARIVGGFYGGELNPLTGYFVIRSRDAHAWVEAWTGDRWTTFDPTPASLRPGTNTTGMLKMYATAIGDSVEFFWDRYILTFGTEDQVALIGAAVSAAAQARDDARAAIDRLEQKVTWRGMVIALLVVGVMIMLPVWFRQVRRPPHEAMILQLERMGIPIEPAATGAEIVARVRDARPEVAPMVEEIVKLHELERFSPLPVSPERRLSAKRALIAISAAAR